MNDDGSVDAGSDASFDASNDDGGDTPNRDAAMDAEPAPNRPPTIVIDFPVTGAVDRAQVRVRGRVSDADDDVLAVTVAGESVEVEDGAFAAIVALADGANAIDVEVTDGRGGAASASVSIERRGALFGNPFDLAVHADSDTVWIADFFIGVIEVDLATGIRRVLDGVASEDASFEVLGIAAAADGSRIFGSFVLDPAGARNSVVMERARDSDRWSLLADPDGSVGGPLRVDAARNRLIAAGSERVWAIDLAEGPSRGALAEVAVAADALWMDFQSNSNELLSAATMTGTTRRSSVELVDLSTGNATEVWSSAADTNFVAASGIAFGGAGAYVADWARGTINWLNLTSGTLSAFSDAADSGPQLMLPEAMVRVDSTLYVVDSGLGALFAVANGGARTVLSTRGTGTGQGFFGPTGMTFDASGDRFLVMDSDPRAGLLVEGAVPSRASLMQVDRRTGNRRVISGEGAGSGTLLPWGTSTVIHPSGVALATTNRMGLLSSAAEAGSLLEIDLESGNRRVVSGANGDDSVVGTGPSLDTAIQVLVESETHALVLQRDKIVRVHLATGNRVIISGPDGADVQGSGPALASATGFVIDGRSDPPLAYVAARDMILEVDLGSGNRRVVSSDADASEGPLFVNAGGIALDVARDRVIVVTPELFRGRDVFIEVSLEDGTRRFLSDQDEASAESRQAREAELTMASGLYFDDEARTLWAIDWSLRSLQVLDADTGETVLFSHFGR